MVTSKSSIISVVRRELTLKYRKTTTTWSMVKITMRTFAALMASQMTDKKLSLWLRLLAVSHSVAVLSFPSLRVKDLQLADALLQGTIPSASMPMIEPRLAALRTTSCRDSETGVSTATKTAAMTKRAASWRLRRRPLVRKTRRARKFTLVQQQQQRIQELRHCCRKMIE